MIRANFSDQGIDLGQNNANLPYLYGLGDFFHVVFEDSSTVNLLLEASTLQASEIYSRFLQLTSTLSLADIQTTTGSQLDLVLLSSLDLVEGTDSKYKLQDRIQSTRLIANRPLAPTALLEENADYVVTQDDDGTCFVEFAAPIHSYPVSSRKLVDGTTQYALWFVDSHLDERLVSSYFGNLIGLDPANSTEQYANLVYGLYYMYTQGPNLDIIKKGLNLVLGIPLARLTETVIDIRTYLQTDQYIVVTDQNQYVIPYGLIPSVSVGDSLQAGSELANWVEVKDYVNDGDWWLNLYIPQKLVPALPPGQVDRYARSGSSLDFIMRNYLKTHTFLVNVNVTTFKDVQHFTQLFDVIKRSKPSYTQPIYVWTVEQEEIADVEEVSAISLVSTLEEDVGGAYHYMVRNSHRPLKRGHSRYIRYNGPTLAKNPVGDDDFSNTATINMQNDILHGYSNSVSQFRANTPREVAWLEAVANRGGDSWRSRRDQVGYRRAPHVYDDMQSHPSGHGMGGGASYKLGVSSDHLWQLRGFRNSSEPYAPIGTSSIGGGRFARLSRHARVSSLFKDIPADVRVVPITVMSSEEFLLKCGLLGIDAPDNSKFSFLIKGERGSATLNTTNVSALGINQGTTKLGVAIDLYPAMFQRDSALPRGMMLNEQITTEFLPSVEDIYPADALWGIRLRQDIVAICLLTYNHLIPAKSFFEVDDCMDHMEVTLTTPAMRGMGGHGSPFYVSRGGFSSTQRPHDRSGALGEQMVGESMVDVALGMDASSGYNTTSHSVNSGVINGPLSDQPSGFRYSDNANSEFLVTRGGFTLTHKLRY